MPFKLYTQSKPLTKIVLKIGTILVYNFNALITVGCHCWLSLCFHIYSDANKGPLDLIKCQELIDIIRETSEADRSLDEGLAQQN